MIAADVFTAFILFVYVCLLVVNTGLLIALFKVGAELKGFRLDLQNDTIERRKWFVGTTCNLESEKVE